MKGVLLRWLARYDAWCQEWGSPRRTGAAARRCDMMRTRKPQTGARLASLKIARHGPVNAVVLKSQPVRISGEAADGVA
jgi:hypothetical protein